MRAIAAGAVTDIAAASRTSTDLPLEVVPDCVHQFPHERAVSKPACVSESDYATLTRVPVLQVGACRIEHRSGICNM